MEISSVQKLSKNFNKEWKVVAVTVRGTPGHFSRIRENMLVRSEACIATQGQHFQHLL